MENGLRKLPRYQQSQFLLWEKILAHKVDNSTGTDKDAYIQDLLALYDNSLKYFPTKYSKAGVAIDKALLMYENKMASDEQLFNLLDKAFQEDQAISPIREHCTYTSQV